MYGSRRCWSPYGCGLINRLFMGLDRLTPHLNQSFFLERSPSGPGTYFPFQQLWYSILTAISGPISGPWCSGSTTTCRPICYWPIDRSSILQTVRYYMDRKLFHARIRSYIIMWNSSFSQYRIRQTPHCGLDPATPEWKWSISPVWGSTYFPENHSDRLR